MGSGCSDIRCRCKPISTDLSLDGEIPCRGVRGKQIVRRGLICPVRIEGGLCSSQQWERIPARLPLPRIVQTANRVNKGCHVTPWRRLHLILTPTATHELIPHSVSQSQRSTTVAPDIPRKAHARRKLEPLIVRSGF